MRIEKKTRTWKDERGMSLVIVLISMVTLGLLATGVAFVAVTEVRTTANYKELAQARYAAEAGVQHTINWLTNNYTAPASFATYNTATNPVRCVNGCTTTGEVVLSGISGVASNYPESGVITAYQNALGAQALSGLATASYSTSAKLVNMTPAATASWAGGAQAPPQTWQITSQGYVSGVHNATVQVVATFERTGTPIFPYAVFATGTSCPTLSLSGGAITDSYDSTAGTYAATVQASGGNVGTNGTLVMGGANTTINGNAYLVNLVTTGSCPTQTFSNTSSVVTGNGGVPIATGTPLTVNAPVYTNPSPPLTSSTSYTNDTSLAPGNYNNVSVSGGATLTLSPGTYNFNSLTLSGNSNLVLSPAGKVVLQIAGAGSPSKALDLSGGTVTNSGGNPSDFQIVYNGSRPITLSGGANSAGVVYAPNSAITMSGQFPWFGSVVGRQYLNSGGAAMHYDRSLNSSLVITGTFHLIGFSWSAF